MRRMEVGHLRRKLVDKELIGNLKVMYLSAYLMLPLDEHLSAKEVSEKVGVTLQTAYRWLLKWTEIGLFDVEEYTGNDIETRHQHRKLYNRITIIKSGVLFELVKEG